MENSAISAPSESHTGHRTVISFGDFRLVPATRTITRAGSPVHLGARALDVLIALIERAGQVVSAKELFAIVWPNIHIEESNLRVHVAALRRALNDGQSGMRFIVNVSRRGYAFVAEIERTSDDGKTEDVRQLPGWGSRDYVPLPRVRIIGRDTEVSELADEISSRRLVTVTGTGGIGKTAVALAAADRLAGQFGDGVILADLGALVGPLVTAHLASLLRLPTPDRQPLEFVVEHLEARRLLIVLDNCEHVVDAVAEIVEAILKGAPQVHILATSRLPLRATGEWVRRLDPLATPPIPNSLATAQLVRFPAIQLFVERAMAVSCKIHAEDAPIVAEICSRLDGLPLAIELAATRVPLFGLRGLADRLDDRFAILTKGRRAALAHHRALGAMIDWSHETLSDREKTAWRRLSVFPGAFTIEAAFAVMRDHLGEDLDLIDTLDGLVEKSLISVEIRAGQPRYRLLESLRLYALNKLIEADEVSLSRRRHASYWYECSVSEHGWHGTPTVEWLARHGDEIADVRAAIEWAFAPGGDVVIGIKLTEASVELWFKMLLLPELRQYLEQAIQLAPEFVELSDKLLVRLRLALSNCIFHEGGSAHKGLEGLRKALAIAECQGDLRAQLQIIWTGWGHCCAQGDYAAIKRWLVRARRVIAKSPELSAAPLYSNMAALSYHLWGKQTSALRYAEQARERVIAFPRIRRGGPLFYEPRIATNAQYARILWLNGYADRAASVIHETTNDAEIANHPLAFGFLLVFAACPVSFWTGDLESAQRYLSMLLSVRTGISVNVWQIFGRFYERVLALLRNSDHERLAPIAATGLTPFQMDTASTFGLGSAASQILLQVVDRGVNWCMPEALRAKGELLLTSGDAETQREAERLYFRSIDISRRQGALSWELRSATSLARLWHKAGRIQEASALLAEVYSRFTEGFETKDLINARMLIDALRRGP